MSGSRIKVPLRCPECGSITLVDYPSLVIATALTLWNNLRLHSDCHDVAWDASQSELQSIREHLGQEWLRVHRLQSRFLRSRLESC